MHGDLTFSFFILAPPPHLDVPLVSMETRNLLLLAPRKVLQPYSSLNQFLPHFS